MKIETEKMLDFLKEVHMGEIQTCLLKFEDKGVNVIAQSVAGTHASYGQLKYTAFNEYEAIGNVGIDGMPILLKILKRLGKELIFSIEGNLFTSKGKTKELSFELIDEKFIDECKPFPSHLEYADSFIIAINQFNDFINDLKENADALINIKTVKGGVILTNTGKYKFSHNIDSEETKGGVECKFGQPLVDVISGLSSKSKGLLKFSLSNNAPLLIEHNTDDYIVKFLIAPRVESD